MKKIILAAFAAATAVTSAQATIFTQTWTGTVTSGYDQANVLGSIGLDMAGYSFTAKYVTYTDKDYADAIGYEGNIENGTRAIINAAITINGHTFTAIPPFSSVGANNPDAASSYAWMYGGQTLYNFVYGNAEVDLSKIGVVIDISSLTGDSINLGEFAYSDPASGASEFVLFNQTYRVDFGDGISGAPAGAVPEPASWAMMIGGFGLIGTAMRRRRAVAMRFS